MMNKEQHDSLNDLFRFEKRIGSKINTKMELFNVPRNTYVRVVDSEVKLPVGNYPLESLKNGIILFFGHVDGMYSFCKDVYGNVVHLAAWTEVEIASEQEFMSQKEILN